MSPRPESPLDAQQFTPLCAFTRRVGSCAFTSSAMRPVSSRSHSPQPSLNGTHTTSEVQLLCSSTIVCSSRSNSARASGGGSSFDVFIAGMSCHTSKPSLSAW